MESAREWKLYTMVVILGKRCYFSSLQYFLIFLFLWVVLTVAVRTLFYLSSPCLSRTLINFLPIYFFFLDLFLFLFTKSNFVNNYIHTECLLHHFSMLLAFYYFIHYTYGRNFFNSKISIFFFTSLQ